mgnify:CR=1 FL=1
MIRFANNITRILQGVLYVCGISIHNNFTDECVPDFSCCCKDIHSPIRKRIRDFAEGTKRIFRI